jgi:hypothetical protein
MINFVRAAVLGIFLSGFSVSSASSTTYEYVGNPLDVVLPCCSTVSGLTWSVTFDFNTSNYSGTVYLHSEHVAAFSGGKENYIPLFGPYFSLNHGAITDWALQAFDYGISSFSNGGIGGDYYSAYRGGNGPSFLAYNSAPGVWTPIDLVAPAPSPAVGAGLPGILLALAGFISWRCSRRAIAA